MKPPYWDEACATLEARDRTLGELIHRHRPDVLRGSGDPFRTLLNAIVGQQISVAAAAGIWRRLQAAVPELSPAALVKTEDTALRSVGLSARKAEYVRGVSQAFLDGRIDPSAWMHQSDDEVRTRLTALRGVGPWTADMVLIFHVQRPDVLPLGDLGLVNAAARLYGWQAEADCRDRLRDHAEQWRPWRTVATWYIWRELDADPVIY